MAQESARCTCDTRRDARTARRPHPRPLPGLRALEDPREVAGKGGTWHQPAHPSHRTAGDSQCRRRPAPCRRRPAPPAYPLRRPARQHPGESPGSARPSASGKAPARCRDARTVVPTRRPESLKERKPTPRLREVGRALRHRQLHREPRAPFGPVRRGHAATVALDERSDDSEAEAVVRLALPGRAAREEAVEDPVAVLGRDPGSVIVDVDDDRGAFLRAMTVTARPEARSRRRSRGGSRRPARAARARRATGSGPGGAWSRIDGL